jgi:Family of unknown function (DUF6939)
VARSRSLPYRPCLFAPYNHLDHLPRGVLIHDVSSYADPPYCTLSPMWVHDGIPVPGMPGATSDSVEGIWQGLKVIRGKTALHLLKGPGRKRSGGKPSGHEYGDRLLGIVEARRKIYCVAYEWVLAHRVDPAIIEGFIQAAFDGMAQVFHDTGDNGDINNTSEPLADAGVLVQCLNRLCARRAEER